MTKIYLVRHGETEGNRDNFYQTPQTPLTKTGIEQAKRVASRLKGKGVSLIYASTHIRTQKTASIISEIVGAPIEQWGSLTEIRRPAQMRGKLVNDPKIQKIGKLVEKNFGNKNWKYSDEENFYDLVERARAVLKHLGERHGRENVVCVSHGTFIKILVAFAVFEDKLTPEVFSSFRYKTWAENTGISILDHSKKYGFRLLSWNDTSHL